MKCPYGSSKDAVPWRERTPIDCSGDSYFFCLKNDDKVELKNTHNYMYQVQGQLAILQLSWAEFVVWTKKGISVEIIDFSETLWNEMLPKLSKYYVDGGVSVESHCFLKLHKILGVG